MVTKSEEPAGAMARKYSAPALEKGLDILELLSRQSDGLSQSEIARSLSRTPSEIFRMLTCLVERGYLDRSSSDDLYRLSAKLFALSHLHPPTKRLLETALPAMRWLAEQARQSCHLAIRHERDALIVAQTDNPGFIGFAVRVGARVPLRGSCSGNVLLAFQTDPGRETWLREIGLGDTASAERRALEAKLRSIRERGHDRRDSPVARGILDIGFPILDASGAAVAALTVPCLEKVQEGASVEEVERLTAQAANQISEGLGGAGAL